MRAHHDPELIETAASKSVAATLEGQAGTILRAQALSAGMTRVKVDQRIRAGRWNRILPGVLTTRDPAAPDVRIWAAYLWAGGGAVLATEAAMFWWGLIDTIPSTIELYVPGDRIRRPQPGVKLIRSDILTTHDIRRRYDMRVTTPARTCLDLARFGRSRDSLEIALRSGKVTPERLARLARHAHYLPGIERAHATIEQARTNPWSPPERDLHRHLTAAGVDGWVANSRAWTATGDVHPDIAFDEVKLAVEINGRRYHAESADPAAFDRGHRREQALVDAGWTVLNFTPKQIAEDPASVIRTIVRVRDRLRRAAA